MGRIGRAEPTSPPFSRSCLNVPGFCRRWNFCPTTRERKSHDCVACYLTNGPQAVHIWQDIPYAAVACALVGIPHFFIHRGSLAPDYWAQNENQSAVHFRPMRHIYRHLLQRPGFVLLNNSLVGCKTDQTWLAWPNPTPFQVVYNAVDFAQLGENTGRNMTLRRELGVPDDAPLIGGAFRIVPVKRPLYWIEAARQIREAIPNAHFVIIGDGDMTDEVAAYACRHGFSAAMHLPGRVSNVGDWYRAMDLHLLTSEREGLPNALIESQHFGVPIVATAVGGVHEAVDIGQTGYVVDGDNGPTPYAQKVIEVLRDLAWHKRALCQSAGLRPRKVQSRPGCRAASGILWRRCGCSRFCPPGHTIVHASQEPSISTGSSEARVCGDSENRRNVSADCVR